MNRKRLFCLLAIVIILGLYFGIHGMKVKADADVTASQNDLNSITITPELIGQIGGPTSCVAVNNGIAYIGVGPRLLVLDISDPALPKLLGQSNILPDDLKATAVSGNYAYIADGQKGGFRVIDISNPEVPVEAGSYVSTGNFLDVEVHGQLAYVAADDEGLLILDISDASNPTVIGKYAQIGAQAMSVQGDYAYIIFTSGLYIINITNPFAPFLEGYYTAIDWLSDVSVEGDFAYVAQGANGLLILDVSTPSMPVELSEDTTFGVMKIVVDGNTVYGAAGLRINIIDVSNRTDPIVIGEIITEDFVSNMVVNGSEAYLATRSGGFNIFNVTDPMSPVNTGNYISVSGVWSVKVAGGYAYVDSESGLFIIDVSDPQNPLVIGNFIGPVMSNDMIASGDYLYLANDWNGFRVIDISDKHTPDEIGYYETVGPLIDIAVVGDYAYLAVERDGLRILDISNPNMPIEVGSFSVEGGVTGVEVVNNFAYIYAGGLSSILVIDITDVHAPVQAGFLASQGAGYDLNIYSDRLFVADGNALRIIDISDRTKPVQVGSYPTESNFINVILNGPYAYIADVWAGLRIIDVSNPAKPTEVGFYALDQTTETGLEGNYAFVGNIIDGLFIFQLITDKAAGGIPIGGGNLTSTDGDTRIVFPSGAFTETVDVTYQQLLNDEHDGYLAGIDHSFDISATYSDTGKTAYLAPNETYTITITYSDSQVSPVFENTLGLYSWNGVTWVREPTSTLDPVNNTITATLNHLSLWAILEDTNRVYMPVMRQ
jgi:hypothetical protein